MMLGIGDTPVTTGNAVSTITAVAAPPLSTWDQFTQGLSIWKQPGEVLRVAPTFLKAATQSPKLALGLAVTPTGLGVLAIPALAIYLLMSMGEGKKTK